MYDVVIIGAGIAGLYSAYLLKKTRPELKFCVLEKNDTAGGRTSTQMFEGVEVVCGAGIGRKRKDRLLIQLLKELGVPYREFMAQHYYAKGVSHRTYQQIAFLEQHLTEDTRMSFKQFAEPLLGKESYREFVVANGYSDFEKADAVDVLKYYGLDDNRGRWTGLSIPWRLLSEALVEKIGRHHIHFGQEVVSIEGSRVKTQGSVYTTKHILCATTIASLKRLFPTKQIYHQIHGQSFLRMYAKVDSVSAEVLNRQLKGVTVVDSPLQEIIPIRPEEGIYMIAYSDNRSADQVYKHKEDSKYFERALEKALSLPNRSIHILSMQPHYWPIGTHYYSVLPKRFKDRMEFIREAQRPVSNVRVVGEVVALDQGWVEGALESVEAVFPEIVKMI